MLTKRQQKRTMIRISISMIPLAVMIGLVLTQNLGVCAASTIQAEEFTIETPETQGKGQIRCESGMPCESREQFMRWYEEYEQETSEETADRSHETTATDETEFETCSESLSEEEDSTKVETDMLDSQVREVVSPSYSCPIYTVNGELMNPELQQYLYDQLSARGVEWMFPYSLCQLYQESRFDSHAQNPNGLDLGIAQLRQPYFEALAREAGLYEYNIFNAIDSIYVYAYLTAKNLTVCCGSVESALSTYYTGDCNSYNAQYVSDVLRWLPTMKGEN